MRNRKVLILSAQAAAFVVSVIVAASTSKAADWQPIELALLLLVLAVGSEALTLQVRGVRMSGSFLAIVLAMALLGPAPAVAIALASVIVDAALDWRGWMPATINFGTYSVFPLVGSILESKPDYEAPSVEEVETEDEPAVTAAGSDCDGGSDIRLKRFVRPLEAAITQLR